MLKGVLHSLVARPAIYNLVQSAAGASVVRKRLSQLVPALPGGSVIIDIGAGTGLYRRIWPANCRYICLDLDPRKLRGFRRNVANFAVQADAVRLPFAPASVDAVAATLMAHHLDDAAFNTMLDEAKRILKPAGVFLFADPLWHPSRWSGRLLWRYDRGAHPRTSAQLRAAIASRLRIDHWTEFALWHRYAACLATKT